MTTPKTLPITVTISTPQILPVRRKAKLVKHSNGYRCVRYGSELDNDGRAKHLNSSLRVLKELVPPSKTVGTGALIVDAPTIDAKSLILFIEEWGVVGFARKDRRDAVIEVISTFVLDQFMGDFSRSRVLLEQTQLFPPTALNLANGEGENFQTMLEQLEGIASGQDIPLRWVEEDLRCLAKMSRLFSYVFNSKAIERGSLRLDQNNKKRILSAWGHLSFQIPDTEDPGGAKYSTRVEWTETIGVGRANLDDGVEIIQRPILEFAEYALHDFERWLNEFLEPMSSRVVRFDVNSVSYGFETALASFFVAQLTNITPRLVCSVCHEIYIPVHILSSNKPRFCSEQCARRERQKRFREKKKLKQVDNLTRKDGK